MYDSVQESFSQHVCFSKENVSNIPVTISVFFNHMMKIKFQSFSRYDLDTSLTHNREVIIAVKKAQSFSTSKTIFIVFLTKKKTRRENKLSF